MDFKTYGYLYYLTHGYSKDRIMEWVGLSEEEFELMGENLKPLLAEIAAKRGLADRIGSVFLELTRYMYGKKHDEVSGVPRPEALKSLDGELIPLPKVAEEQRPQLSLDDAVAQRRSLRVYSQEHLSLQELSYLLWASFQVIKSKGESYVELTLRNTPSAGGCHPLECYLLINRVTGIGPGLYHYNPLDHCLVKLDCPENIGEKIHDYCHFQKKVQDAAVNFIISAIPYRTVWRYGQRGYRFLYLDAGHVGQNIHLAAEAICGGACMITSFWDEGLNECIGADGESEFVIYIASVGKKLGDIQAG